MYRELLMKNQLKGNRTMEEYMGAYGEEEVSYEEKDYVFWRDFEADLEDFEADLEAWSLQDAEQDYEEHLYDNGTLKEGE